MNTPASTPVTRDGPGRPAAKLAGLYILVSLVYIVSSSAIARQFADSLDALKWYETAKGVLFVFVTGALIFVVSRRQFARLSERERQVRRMDRALANSNQGVLAGMLATTVAHDINNALMVAMAAIDEMESQTAHQPELVALSQESRTALDRIRGWNRRFFELGRARGVGEMVAFDLAEAVRGCCHMVRHHHRLERIAVALDVPTALAFQGYHAALQRAILNLLLNAAEAAGGEGHVQLTVLPFEPGAARILIDDDGPGVPVAVREKILQPFYTTKSDGTGLGLASVSECANLHQGTIEVLDSPLGGARFALTLRSVA